MSLTDGIMYFGRRCCISKYCEGLYEPYGKAPFNAFQRLQQGSELWNKALNECYSDWLSDQELSDLNILFQKRHILSHNEGIVDEIYIKKSGDASYKVNQRIVVSNRDIDLLLICLEKMSHGLVAAIKKRA